MEFILAVQDFMLSCVTSSSWGWWQTSSPAPPHFNLLCISCVPPLISFSSLYSWCRALPCSISRKLGVKPVGLWWVSIFSFPNENCWVALVTNQQKVHLLSAVVLECFLLIEHIKWTVYDDLQNRWCNQVSSRSHILNLHMDSGGRS